SRTCEKGRRRYLVLSTRCHPGRCSGPTRRRYVFALSASFGRAHRRRFSRQYGASGTPADTRERPGPWAAGVSACLDHCSRVDPVKDGSRGRATVGARSVHLCRGATPGRARWPGRCYRTRAMAVPVSSPVATAMIGVASAMEDTFDALLIGGGPAGSTAALLLARAGWSVCVLERKELPRRKVCGAYISASTLPLLDRMGLLDSVLEMAGPAVRRVGLFTGRSMLDAPLPRPGRSQIWGRALGRDRLDQRLLRQAEAAGAVIRQPF